MTSAVRRPLRAVGRAVTRRETSRGRQGEDLPDGDECVSPDEPAIVNSSMDYGTLVEVANGDEQDANSSKSKPASNSMRRRSSRSLLDATSRRRIEFDWAVHSMEQTMRTIVLMCLAYIVGAKKPEWLTYIVRVTEYFVTAWVTCLLILLLAQFQRNHPKWGRGLAPVPLRREEELNYLPNQSLSVPVAVTPREQQQSSINSVHRELPPLQTPDTLPSDIPQATPHVPIKRISSLDESVASTPETPLSHPAMSCFYIVDANTGERIYPNSATPVHISNEWFDLDMLVLLRTPDVDDPKAEKGLPCNDKWVEYLRPRQRRFEFQYQMKLKKLPKGKAFYFSCEVDQPIKMGVIQRAFVGAAMAFMKSANPTFHYSITGSKERTADGRYEKPHMSFTVEYSLDRLVITKPGETPPQLGTVIHEDPDALKQRKKGAPVDWNLQDTYTMALWSAYVDFLDWRVLNLPGIRPFGLAPILGTQGFSMSMYLIEEKRDNDKHYQKDITNVVNFELSNDKYAEKGPCARKWAEAHERKQKEKLQRPNTSSIESNDTTEGGDDLLLGQELQTARSTEEVQVEEDEEDAETAAQLGEGIYVRSGDSVCLREFQDNVDFDNSKVSCVANGGGFAVLQEQDSIVIIEKTRRSKKSQLIKSGDTVLFKRIQKNGDETETRYLTIHRGWWLKWVLTVPSKNGFFTIHTQETEFEKAGHGSTHTIDTQSSYLTMGGSFTLRHKRWSNYHVGVAGEPSPTYGGRMLGLYNPKRTDNATAEEQYQSEEGEPDEAFPELKASKPTWMQPLTLTAIEPPTLAVPSLPITPRSRSDQNADGDEMPLDSPGYFNPHALIFSADHTHADVPAWIEMLNRTKRTRQLTYVVRVSRRPKEEQKVETEDIEGIDKRPDTFIRLRTGRELAQIMRVGQSVRHSLFADDPSPRAQRKSDMRLTGSEKSAALSRTNHSLRQSSQSSVDLTPGAMTPPASDGIDPTLLDGGQHNEGGVTQEIPSEFTFDTIGKGDDSDEESIESVEEEHQYESDDALLNSTYEYVEEEGEEVEVESELETDLSENEGEQTEPEEGPRKKKGVVGKSKALLGKSVKATAGGVVKTAKLGVKTTKLTGKVALATGKLSAKAVVGASKLTGKAAVGTTKVAFRGGKKAVNAGKTAGRAVIAPVSRKSKKPPKTEPKTKHHKEKDVAVSKTLKKMTRLEKKAAGSPAFLAGELCAPEQSRRTASRVLSRMSGVPFRSTHWKSFNMALSAQVEDETEQDRWFLEGTSVELGVIPLAGDKSRGKLRGESVVARCLWESHWREEWCGIYDTCLSFYSPLSKTPCSEIAFIDITNVRPLDAGGLSPLPGFPLLVLETAWLCHYIAFHDEEARDTFGEKVDNAVEMHIKQVEESALLQEEELRKARFWQGFQSLSESSLSTGMGKWAKIPSKEKLKERVILNGRRMAFDNQIACLADATNGFEFVEDLLSKVLSFSLDSLEKNPASFVDFLDLTSQLRMLPLEEVDLSSKDAFCLFANIYHCLLQQAMLLSVNGPLHKKSVGHFMRTACYEIGSDVFSLAELYCYVLRGKMCKPLNPKPPYIEAPKKSQAYRFYALDYKDPRINFVLNTGDVTCPRVIPVLRASELDQQLSDAARNFLKNSVTSDRKKRSVILPKVCEVYKHDFGGDNMACLRYCIAYMDESTGSAIRAMIAEGANLTIKYQMASDQYHTSLKLQGQAQSFDDDQVPVL